MIHAGEHALEVLHALGVREKIAFGLVLGTGLGRLAEAVEQSIKVPYSELPDFPVSNVSGHAGQLVIGKLGGISVALLQGRAHYYERGDARAMATAIATLSLMGAHSILLTNSAGSLHSDWHPGSLAVISDHINFSGMNPLIGTSSDQRFVSMNNAYDSHLRQRLKKASAAAAVAVHEGVYMWFSGPSFETPAEVRLAKKLGADLVGMSTVPEVILARSLGMRTVAVSVVSNFAAGIAGGNPSHQETKQTALRGSVALQQVIRSFLRGEDD